jgi:hypothetical protein
MYSFWTEHENWVHLDVKPVSSPLGAAEFESVFRFSPARQVPAIIQNEYSRNTENAWERDYKVFYENQSISGFFGFECSFQNYFRNLFRTSDLSQI